MRTRCFRDFLIYVFRCNNFINTFMNNIFWICQQESCVLRRSKGPGILERWLSEFLWLDEKMWVYDPMLAYCACCKVWFFVDCRGALTQHQNTTQHKQYFKVNICAKSFFVLPRSLTFFSFSYIIICFHSDGLSLTDRAAHPVMFLPGQRPTHRTMMMNTYIWRRWKPNPRSGIPIWCFEYIILLFPLNYFCHFHLICRIALLQDLAINLEFRFSKTNFSNVYR